MNVAYWDFYECTDEVKDIGSYNPYGSEIESSRPAKGERALI